MTAEALKQLFDYQKFEQSRELQQVIDSVHGRYTVRELSMDYMENVAAAGMPYIPGKQGRQ